MTMIFATARTHHGFPWSQVKSQVKHHIVEWRRRIRSRRELDGLSDIVLRDIGLSRAEARCEAAKPFWMG